MINQNKNVKGFAISQVIFLVVSIFALGWIIGSSIDTVSASDICSVNGEQGNCIGSDGSCSGPTSTSSSCSNGQVCCVSQEEGGVDAGKIAQGVIGPGAGYIVQKKLGSLIFPPKEAVASSAKGALDASAATGVGTGTAELGLLETKTVLPKLFGGGSTGAVGSIAISFAWSAVAFAVGRFIIGPALGLSASQSQGLGYSLAAGTFAGLNAINLFAVSGLAGFGIGAGVAFVVSLFTVKNTSLDIINYGCYAWDAPLGGEDCEACNNQDIECTEYQCRSLGQGCEFSIDSVSGQPLCTWNNSKDILAPQISPRLDSLVSSDYEYSPDNALSPPDTGVKVDYVPSEDNCAPAWTEVSFGIETDERARCKFSPGILYDTYEEMPDLFLSGGIRTQNHTYGLSLPSTDALEAENVTVENGGIYNFYIRCQDSNGNSNKGNFGVSFCIDEGPDTVAPVIDHTTPLNNAPFASGQTEFPVDLYVNEPAECRWSSIDKSYGAMENNFSCATSALNPNTQNLFRCSGSLDGLKDNQENNFYFRCEDQPHLRGTENENLRNTNEQSYSYTLTGTQELVITSASPNNTKIKDSTSRIPVEIKVETSLGADDGKAVCRLSETGEEGSFINFFYGQGAEPYTAHEHSQTLNLDEGDYNYYLRCEDRGGNTDTTAINFEVETDTEPPSIVRIYEESNKLKIITNEEAQCRYGNTDRNFDFDDGVEMTTLNDLEHFTEWNNKLTFFIKCEDQYGQRTSSQDAVVVRPFNV